MKILSSSMLFFAAALAAATGRSGPTGEAFYGDPPDATHPWAVHDQNRPQPPRVEPGPLKEAKPPEGAIVLFDGSEGAINNWEADKNPAEPTKWIVKDGALQCVPKAGYIRTKAKIGDCQLHVEWAAPTPPEGAGQGRGNSGIFLMGQAEIQVLDNYNNPTYADGSACAMYAISPPLANALRAPGEWQQIDITFRRPIFKDGKCVDPGFVTVYCNGVLVQDRVQLEGNTGHMKRPKMNDFGDAAPLKFQDHGNPVRFRNVWYQPLPERTAADVAKTVPMSEEATAAKRKEIAAMVREDAAKKTGYDQAMRYGESLVYEKNDAAYTAFETFGKTYAADVKDDSKDATKRLTNAFKYLARHKIIEDNDPAKLALEAVMKARDWK